MCPNYPGICHHVLTLSMQLQNSSFHVVERTRTSLKCQKLKNALAKILFFVVKIYMQICGVYVTVIVVVALSSLIINVEHNHFSHYVVT